VTLYGASKAGLSHFTGGIRSEFRGKPVGTTLVQLGEVKTDMIDHIRDFGPARRTIERSLRWRMLPSSALEPDAVAEAIADAIERNRRHVILPRRIAVMAKFTEFPRRVSEIMLTGIDQEKD
jgi:short-subunit dehydrogenase